MGNLQPNALTGIPYISPELRGQDGYMNTLELDEEARKIIYSEREKSSHILDNKDGIFHELSLVLPNFSTEDKVIVGTGSIEIIRDDIDGLTVIEDIQKYNFDFSIKKANFKAGTVYGSYDEYEVEFESFSVKDSIMSEALRSSLELRIKEKIISQIKQQHQHTNGED